MSALRSVLAVVGAWLVLGAASCAEKGEGAAAGKTDKSSQARHAPSAQPNVKMNARGGMAACQKVEAAGIGSDCQAFEKMVKFKIPSEPEGSGAVLTFEDPVVYKMFFTSLVKEKSDSAFGSAKARTVVILTGVPSTELQARTKAVVDAL